MSNFINSNCFCCFLIIVRPVLRGKVMTVKCLSLQSWHWLFKRYIVLTTGQRYILWITRLFGLQGSKLKRSLGCLLVTNWRNIVTNLYNVNDAAHSLARSVKFDSLKTFQTEVGINFEVNWLCLNEDLAHFFMTKAKQD